MAEEGIERHLILTTVHTLGHVEIGPFTRRWLRNGRKSINLHFALIYGRQISNAPCNTEAKTKHEKASHPMVLIVEGVLS